MQFEIATPTRIVFGDGAVAGLPGLVREVLGEPEGPIPALVVVGSSVARTTAVRQGLKFAGIDSTPFQVSGEPTVDVARQGVDIARVTGAHVVVAIGGGSVIDAAKAIAVLAPNDGDVFDYLEVIGRGHPLTRESIPVVAVPTTAGSGSEVTRNAVLASPEHAVKVSLRSATMLPRLALVDPVLTHGVPPDVTASTGLDAFTQVLEPFVSHQSNPFTDALARDGLARAARSLRQAYDHGNDADARRDMALTSLFGGLALANAKLGAVHGLAGPLGGMVPSPHGAVCARLLPLVMETNLAALRSRAPASPAIGRYDEVARIVTGRADAVAQDGVEWVRSLAEALKIRPLRDYGVQREDVPLIADKAARASSMKGNPIELTVAELCEVLERAL